MFDWVVVCLVFWKFFFRGFLRTLPPKEQIGEEFSILAAHKTPLENDNRFVSQFIIVESNNEQGEGTITNHIIDSTDNDNVPDKSGEQFELHQREQGHSVDENQEETNDGVTESPDESISETVDIPRRFSEGG